MDANTSTDARTPSNETEPPVLQFAQVSYTFPNSPQESLQGLTFALPRGQTLVLLGESGSGKTTLLRLILRFLLPTEGEVFVEGTSTQLWDAVSLRKRIGYVFQHVGLFPHYTVAENIGLPLELAGVSPRDQALRVAELLAHVDLAAETFASRYPHELSGGQRQRVGVARALASSPPLLVMDEPFGALDPLTRAALQEEFHRLVRTLGLSVVLVTHDLQEALRLGDVIGLLKEGQLRFLGPTHEFLSSHDPYAQAYAETYRLPLPGRLS